MARRVGPLQMLRALCCSLVLASAAWAGEPAWLPIGAHAAALATGLRDTAMGGEVSLYLTLGPAPRAVGEALEGWRVQLGAQVGRSVVGGAVCHGGSGCVNRAFAGVSLRVGFLRGFPIGASGPFGQWDVLGTYVQRKSAPLLPGLDQGELLTRLRLGWQWAPPTPTRDGWTFFVAAVVEALPLPGETQGVSFGLALGAGL